MISKWDWHLSPTCWPKSRSIQSKLISFQSGDDEPMSDNEFSRDGDSPDVMARVPESDVDPETLDKLRRQVRRHWALSNEENGITYIGTRSLISVSTGARGAGGNRKRAQSSKLEFVSIWQQWEHHRRWSFAQRHCLTRRVGWPRGLSKGIPHLSSVPPSVVITP